MNPIIRNLISIIRRYKLAAILNILGLSVAFAAFMIIMMQLDFDYGFDKCHKNYEWRTRFISGKRIDCNARIF